VYFFRAIGLDCQPFAGIYFLKRRQPSIGPLAAPSKLAIDSVTADKSCARTGALTAPSAQQSRQYPTPEKRRDSISRIAPGCLASNAVLTELYVEDPMWLVFYRPVMAYRQRDAAQRGADRPLQGDISVDDAYLGGERTGRVRMQIGDKVAFVAAVEMREGRPQPVRFDPVAVLAWGMDSARGYWIIEPAIFMPGAGRGRVMPDMTIVVQNALPVPRRGVGTAMLTCFRSLGGPHGVSGAGAILACGRAAGRAGADGGSVPPRRRQHRRCRRADRAGGSRRAAVPAGAAADGSRGGEAG
jgi:hypothetical protein